MAPKQAAAEGKRDASSPVKGEHQDKRQKTDKAEPRGLLEEGKIFFLYRPRVGFEEAHSLSDVQRFYFVLEPDAGKLKRLVVVGKKKLPAKQERYFGFVEAVSEDTGELTSGMGPVDNETKTRGTRHTEPARIAGQGRYSIAEKDVSTTYLVWKLEVPHEAAKVQEDLGISTEGSLALSVKNPKKPNPGNPNIGLDNKADFGEKQKLFDGTPGGYAWISVKDPALLDHQNAELLMIGTGAGIKDQLGPELEHHVDEKIAEDAKEAGVEETARTEEEEAKLIEELKKELRAEKVELEAAPAEAQEWK